MDNQFQNQDQKACATCGSNKTIIAAVVVVVVIALGVWYYTSQKPVSPATETAPVSTSTDVAPVAPVNNAPVATTTATTTK